MIRGWKGTQLLINQRLSGLERLRVVLEVFRCAEGRTEAVIPESFCQPGHEPGWGCKRLTTIRAGLPVASWQVQRESYWFQFGRFDKACEAWHVDKRRLLKALVREAALKHVGLCPFFNKETVQQQVAALPDKIELGEDSAWTILYKEKCDSSTLQREPVGIQPKQVDRHYPRDLSVSISVGPEDVGPEEDRGRYIPNISFEDIGEVDEIIGKVRDVIELPLRHPALFKHLGIRPHKGILLYGPPGCGKSLLAKAISNEVAAHFISIRGPELYTKWFGESEACLRSIFEEAGTRAPSIIFFDEIDAIAAKRSGGESNRYSAAFLNQLLALMDGVETYANVCVLASTNRPELLDDAVTRPGRFDYHLEVKRPSPSGCRRIFQIHTGQMPLASDFDLESIVSELAGCTGSEIAFVAREGAYNCLRRCAPIDGLIKENQTDLDLTPFEVTAQDFQKALETMGRSGSRTLSQMRP